MPKKFIRCVKKVERSQRLHRGYKRVNPYAVCRVSTGYYGSSHHIGLKHKMTKDKFRINIPRKEVVVYDDSGRPLYPVKKKSNVKYALFTSDVKAMDKYKVTSPPKKFFKSRTEAKRYVKKRYGTLKGTKIMKY